MGFRLQLKLILRVHTPICHFHFRQDLFQFGLFLIIYLWTLIYAHDFNAFINTFSGNQPSKDTIHRYRSTWGDDYFSFWTHGCLFIVLNSQLYEDCSLTEDLASEQDEWLDQVLLETEKAKYTFVFQHIPWFLKTPDEDKEYFNIETGLRMKMLNKFYDAGVSKIFCGHYHRNTGGL